MKNSIPFLFLTGALLLSCKSSSITEDERLKELKFRVTAGLNKGGVTENTDFDKTPEIPIDAFSGATKTGFSFGAHAVKPMGRNAIEGGLDYMYNNQTFTYNDAANGNIGNRKIGVSQFMIPLTYNIDLFRKNSQKGLFQFKVGLLGQFNLLNVKNSGISIPPYSYNNYSFGFTMGVATNPFKIKNGAELGFYIDGYRGTKIFNDYYNRSIYEMPGSSFMRLGIIYQFGKFNK